MKTPFIELDPEMPERMHYLGLIEDRQNNRAALLTRQSDDGYVRLYVTQGPGLNDLLQVESYGVAPQAFTDFKINSPFINSVAHINFEACALAITHARRDLVASVMPGSRIKPGFILEDNLTIHHVSDVRPLAIPTPQPGVYIAVDPIPGASKDQLIPLALQNTQTNNFQIFACRTLKM